MILPIDWLKQFVKVDESPEELAEIFLMLGFPADTVTDEYLDLEVTPNRGDVLSVYGLAREYAAYKNIDLAPYATPLSGADTKSDLVSFSAQAEPRIWRYSYLVARGGKVGESTPDVKKRLNTIGLNAKNNIIDITNYLMHECGQPLHAFDLNKVSKLHIDFAKEGERIDLLGSVTAKVGAENLVGYDDKALVDLVGISGGTIPAINKDTCDILIQAAILDPVTIRRSSKASGVATPASYRYERGVDHELPMAALAKAAEYLKQWGFIIEVAVDIAPNLPIATTIELTGQKVAEISGSKITNEQLLKPLERLGFKKTGDNSYRVPSWRQLDVKIPVEIAEEVIRLNGFNNIKPIALPSWPVNFDKEAYHNDIRALLYHHGNTEHYSYSFISTREAEALANTKELNIKLEDLVEVANPLSENNRYMRPTLLVGLLRAASNNRWTDDIRFFEIGHIFKKDKKEQEYIGAIGTKNILGFGTSNQINIMPDSPLGKLFKIKKTLRYSETDIANVPSKPGSDTVETNANQFRAVSKFPPVVMDLAIVMDNNVPSKDVTKEVMTGNPAVILAECFDEFESEAKFGKGKKSIAIRIVYQDLKRTLTSEEAQIMHREVLQKLKQKFNATLRA